MMAREQQCSECTDKPVVTSTPSEIHRRQSKGKVCRVWLVLVIQAVVIIATASQPASCPIVHELHNGNSRLPASRSTIESV